MNNTLKLSSAIIAGTLVEPFVWDAYFIWKPGEQINPYECTLEEWASPENTLTN
jgi:hypothetical protein